MRPLKTVLVVSLAVLLSACMATSPRYHSMSSIPHAVDQTDAVRIASLVLVDHGYTPSVVNENVGMISTEWRTTGGWQKVLFGQTYRNRVNVAITESTLTVSGENQMRLGDSLIEAIFDDDGDHNSGDTGWFGSNPSEELRAEWREIERDITDRLANAEEATQTASFAAPSSSGPSETVRSSGSTRRATGERMPVAVLDFKGLGLDKQETAILSDRLRAELVGMGVFQVVERGRMQEILEEQGLQQNAVCNTDECAVEMGRMIGVQQIVAGSIGGWGTPSRQRCG